MRTVNNQPRQRTQHPMPALSPVLFLIGLAVLGCLWLRQRGQLQKLQRSGTGPVHQVNERVKQLIDAQRRFDQRIEQEIAEFKAQVNRSRKYSEGMVCDYRSAEEMVAGVAGGVCLIQGEYTFVDPKTGQLLRHVQEAQAKSAQRDTQAEPFAWGKWSAAGEDSKDTSGVSVNGTGRPLVVQYTGTGFLIDRGGHIVTNKHVVTPWEVSPEYGEVLQAGYEARRGMFRAFFPYHSDPFNLKVVSTADANDVALLYADIAGAGIAALPCGSAAGSLRVGQTVIVLGYPTGFDILMARMSQEELDSIMGGDEGGSFDQMARNMARRRLIQPLATRGMCGRVSGGKILYDAQTAIGGSGGPVLGANGEVVAINTALLKGFAGTNFGIPISAALDLLAEVGLVEPDKRTAKSPAGPAGM